MEILAILTPSWPLLAALTGQRVTDDKDVNKAQDDIGSTAGGLVGKGGLGEGAGDAVSKGL